VEVHQCECAVCQAGQETELIAYHRHINLVLSRLEEAERRWYVASLSSAPGAPSDAVLAQISGLSDKTIARGRQELEADLKDAADGRQRQAGGGRKKAEKKTRR
jgi:hypothetical protein